MLPRMQQLFNDILSTIEIPLLVEITCDINFKDTKKDNFF